jgi:hypothetical protein
MGVGARGVDGVDAVNPAVKDRRAFVDFMRVGAVGRVEFGGDGEFAAAQDTLQSAARGVSRQGFEQAPGSSGWCRSGFTFGSRLTGVCLWRQRRARLRRWRSRAARTRFRAATDRRASGRRGSCRGPDILLGTGPGLHPDAGHVRFDLAMAIGADAAAGAVAQLLRAVHRARHAGRGQHALAAHPAIEQEALYVLSRRI